MDFGSVLEKLDTFLAEKSYRFALVGGITLAAHGIVRTTLDLDLAVEARAQDELVAFMEASGYTSLHRSAGFSNHLHSDSAYGRVDFVYVRGDTAEALFEQAHLLEGPRGKNVRVASPEHLLAMKVAAMKSDPARAFQELADIRALLRLPGAAHDAARRQFTKYDLLERFRELEKDF